MRHDKVEPSVIHGHPLLRRVKMDSIDGSIASGFRFLLKLDQTRKSDEMNPQHFSESRLNWNRKRKLGSLFYQVSSISLPCRFPWVRRPFCMFDLTMWIHIIRLRCAFLVLPNVCFDLTNDPKIVQWIGSKFKGTICTKPPCVKSMVSCRYFHDVPLNQSLEWL